MLINFVKEGGTDLKFIFGRCLIKVALCICFVFSSVVNAYGYFIHDGGIDLESSSTWFALLLLAIFLMTAICAFVDEILWRLPIWITRLGHILLDLRDYALEVEIPFAGTLLLAITLATMALVGACLGK